MTLRERFKEETGKCCAQDRRRECEDTRVPLWEYVEWLEKLLQSTECEIGITDNKGCRNWGSDYEQCPTCTHNVNIDDHLRVDDADVISFN